MTLLFVSLSNERSMIRQYISTNNPPGHTVVYGSRRLPTNKAENVRARTVAEPIGPLAKKSQS